MFIEVPKTGLKVKLVVSAKCFLLVIFLYFITVCLVYNCILELKYDSKSTPTESDVFVAQTDEALRDVYKLRWNSKEKVFFKKVRSFSKNDAEKDGGKLQNNIFNLNVKGGNYKQYTKVTKDFHIFSAFYDNRLFTPYIRIISTLKKYSADVNRFWCHFQISDGDVKHTAYVSSKLVFYEMCENHKRPIGGWLLSCEVPKEVTSVPLTVKISTSHIYQKKPADTTTVLITKVITPENHQNRTSKNKIETTGICVPPLYGSIQPKAFIEFIELSRILGINKIIFYVFDIQSEIQKILQHYVSLQYIETVSWELPFHWKSLWNYGQSLAINDCLYRHMNEFDFLAFLDIDEVLVPRTNDKTWKDFLMSMSQTSQSDSSDYCGYTFRSTFFDPEFSRTVYSNEANAVVRVNRSKHFSFFRNKVIVRPTRIFELGIHHVSRSWPDKKNYTVVPVDPSLAAVYHYRTCISEFGINCRAVEEDLIVPLKYGRQLSRNVINSMLRIIR